MAASALLLLAAAAVAPPAKAGPVEHLHAKVVEAIRNCPEPVEGEIAVCAKDRGVAEGWRLPKLDPRYAGAGLRPSGRGTSAAAAAEAGAASGAGSCSATGAGGATGCQLQLDDGWGVWKKQQQAEGRSFPW